jgi:XTP/dITP diphosphohydrolase
MQGALRIYLASTSPGKLKDFAAAAASSSADCQVELLPLPGLAAMPTPAEDELTFCGNASAKVLAYAREAARRSPELIGALILADDSGLEVDALHGAPGIRSARYAEDHAYEPARHLRPLRHLTLDDRNNCLLLEQLARTKVRSARYRCALALARSALQPAVLAQAEGTLEGEILTELRGEGGFGYDPLFLIPETGCTMAELPLDQRLRFSHRGRALRRLLEGGWN